ncbi:MAG TPA: hypothetical protein VLT36_24045 [Candidatus Dormibacteraeota bacterium]|nr:hypothetical protein [Candidatus Dormibacteraeota bacterium]
MPAAEQPTPVLGRRDSLGEVLWESAVEAFVNAILVVTLGSVAVGLVGGIFQKMAPSAPPGFAGASDSPAGAYSQSAARMFQHHRVAIVFSMLFAVTAWSRLKKTPPEGASTTVTWSKKVAHRLSNEWFGLIVGNAFSAMIGAMVLVWVQQFSVWNLLYQSLLHPLVARAQELLGSAVGGSRSQALQNWFSWYNANQLRFSFWFLYLAAICDDLGIPNLKTVTRRWWKRFLARKTNPVIETEAPG